MVDTLHAKLKIVPSSKMNIVFLNQFYPPDTAATGQLLKDIAVALAQKGHHIEIIASSGGYAGGKIEDTNTIQNLKVHRINATSFGRANKLGRLLDYLSFFTKTKRQLKQLNPDIIVTLTTPPFIGSIIRKHKAKKYLWSMDLYPEVLDAFGYLKANSFIYKRLQSAAHKIYHSMDGVILLGTCMQNKLAPYQIPADKIHLLENWVPSESVERLEPSNQHSIQYSGNIGLGHPVETLLNCFHAIDTKDWNLDIIGFGANRKNLEVLAESLNNPSIHFKEPVPIEELSLSLAKASVHFIAQKSETTGCIVPSKLYGAMASGRAIIFYGPKESQIAQTILKAHCGFVIQDDAPHSLENCLKDIISDPSSIAALGENGLNFYKNHLAMKQAIERFETILELN